MAWRRMQQFSFGLWLLPESLGAAPRRSLALARGLVRAGCPLERIIAVEGNAARIGQHLAGHVDGCPPLRVFTAFRHARVPKGCKNCVKDISENDDPLRSWAAGTLLSLAMAAAFLLLHQDQESESADDLRRANWRMPPLRDCR